MKICDAHTDFLTEIKNQDNREQYVKKIRKVANNICCAIFTTNSTMSVKDVENFKFEIEKYNKIYKTKLMLTIEDLGFIKTKEDLFKLIELKPFNVTLTWNDKNQFSGGANTNKGLTKLGIETIKILEHNNILIDTAHLSRKAFFQFAKITKKPIFNSHTNLHKLFKHKRNLTDKQIKRIVRSGGFIGLTFYQKFISQEKISARDIALQFDYLIKKFGYKNFGIGTDLYGFENQFLPTDFKSYFDVKILINELKKLNYSNKIIKAIIYKNFKKFKNNSKKS
ncbi:MAG: dipeptidase [Clostridia bacterium]|nr:dipeptidase [Clostridia bacterium]